MNAAKSAAQKLAGQMKGGAPKGSSNALIGIALLAGTGYAASSALITIRPGYKGLVYNRFGPTGGGIDESKTMVEGLNIIIPWFQRPIIFDCQTRPQLINTHSGSKDLQMVQISLRVLFRPDGGRLASLYRLLGTDYDERVLPSIVNEVTKAVVAQYKAAELLTMRETVSAQIREVLRKRAGDFNILLDDVAITHLAFSKEYTAAVEAKQVALQESQRAKYIVDKARMEKESIIVKATGEARSAELIGTAIRKNPAFLQLRRIDAAKEVASSVVNSAGKIYIDSENLLLNHLGEQTDLDKEQKAWWRW